MMGELHLLPGSTFSSIKDRGEYKPAKMASLGEASRFSSTALRCGRCVPTQRSQMRAIHSWLWIPIAICAGLLAHSTHMVLQSVRTGRNNSAQAARSST
jgi:hypothetical protein